MPDNGTIADTHSPPAGAPSRELLKRVVSAAVLAPVVLGAVYLGGPAWFALVAVAILLMAYEWSRLTSRAQWLLDALIQCVSGLAAAGSVAYPWFAASIGAPPLVTAVGIIAVGTGFAAACALVRRRSVGWPVAGIPYIALGAVALVWVRQQDDVGLTLIMWLLSIVWAMDIGAYFSGRAIGGPRLAPRASPNKTWAGLIGGMVCAAATGAAMGELSGLAAAIPLAMASAAIGAWSQLGDIVESAVKRHFGVKDMSNLIPGHGGILDRVDGLLFAAPAVMLAAILFSFPWS